MVDDGSLLSTADLLNFNNSVAQGSTSNIIAQGLGAFNPNMSTWDPATQGIASFGKSFLQGFLQNQARADAANQLQSVVGLLPQLQSNPGGVILPEGVDANAGNILKGTAILRKAQNDAVLAETKKTRVNDLLKTVLARGSLPVEDAFKIATSNDPQSAFEGVLSMQKEKPAVFDASAISNDMPMLSNGRASTAERIKQLTNYFLSDGNSTPAQAAISARQQVEAEMKSNVKSFDEAKQAREYGQRLLDLASTARAGMEQAGQTGRFNSVANLYENITGALGSEEGKKQSTGDAILDSIAPEIIKMSRSPGAVSDFESKMYLGAGPGTRQTPETNAIMVKKLEDLGRLNLEYGDFLDAYRDQNSGSTVGAAKKWKEYETAFPIFKRNAQNIELNSDRPSWQEFFSGNVDKPAARQTEIPTAYSVNELKSAGYTDADISALRLQGKVK